MKRFLALLLVFASLAMMFVACGDDKEDAKTEDKADGGNKQDPVDALVGTWGWDDDGSAVTVTLNKDGTGTIGDESGTLDLKWSESKGTITAVAVMTFGEETVEEELFADAAYSISGNKLTITKDGESMVWTKK